MVIPTIHVARLATDVAANIAPAAIRSTGSMAALATATSCSSSSSSDYNGCIDFWRAGCFGISLRDSGGCLARDPPWKSVRNIFDAASEVRSRGPCQSASPDGKSGTPSSPGSVPPRSERRFWKGLISPPRAEHRGHVREDWKRTLDLTTEALQSSRLARRVGPDFQHVQSFFEIHAGELVRLLVADLQRHLGLPMQPLTEHRMHRLLDYDIKLRASPRTESCTEEEWCQSHFDYGTFTLIWADKAGLHVKVNPDTEATDEKEIWVRAPPDADVMVVAGKLLNLVSHGSGMFAALQPHVGCFIEVEKST